ncbi:hypothetical protein BDV96DRAFT_679284 [Lophiotrema nucula]|uniref:Uncharacterized protein n=1 Tax=Lophiotrema nucula TaxID=690887 RepID=A0A6A5YE95_9PLEO|nr:hypothetical protein BDV96DRAFT_679284 [Lophiotrema nucula]
MATTYQVLVIVPALLSGLLVLLQLCRLWKSWPLSPWVRWFNFALLLLYFTAVVITSVLWLRVRTSSYRALLLLLEFIWLNGVYSQVRIQIHAGSVHLTRIQVFMLMLLSKSLYRKRVPIVISVIATVTQVVGFGLLQSPGLKLEGKFVIFAGVFLFQSFAACMVYLLFWSSNKSRLITRAFAAVLTLAALSVVPILIRLGDNNDWFLLVGQPVIRDAPPD